LLVGPSHTLGVLTDSLIAAVCMGLFLLLLMLLLRIVLRRAWLTNVLFVVILTIGSKLTSEYSSAFPWATHAIISAGLALVLARLGLLPAMVSLWIHYLLRNSPLTMDVQAWYGSTTGVLLLLMVLFWGYALRQTLKRGWAA